MEPGGVGGEEEEELLFSGRRLNFQLLESVFGGVLFTQCGDIPLLMAGSKILNCKQESESESKKATVFCGIVINGLFVFLIFLSSVLDNESVDSIVLVQLQINQIQKESL